MSITKQNRKEAYCSVIQKRHNRKSAICSVLEAGSPGGMTAEEILDAISRKAGSVLMDMNYVRPRLTEMKSEGLVRVVGKRPSSRSGRNTSVWKLVPQANQ